MAIATLLTTLLACQSKAYNDGETVAESLCTCYNTDTTQFNYTGDARTIALWKNYEKGFLHPEYTEFKKGFKSGVEKYCPELKHMLMNELLR